MEYGYQSLMSRFSVQGFPTILVFGADKDTPVPYEGARTASAIESFALEQLETNVAPPEVTELTGPVSLSSSQKVHFMWIYYVGSIKPYVKLPCRMSWRRSVAQLPFVLLLSFLTFWTPRQKEGTNTLRWCYQLQRSSKGVLTGMWIRII